MLIEEGQIASQEEFASAVGRRGDSCRSYESPWFGKDAQPWEAEQELIMGWLAGLPRPVGIMACNDLRGQHVLDACKRLDLAVPEGVAVLGVDDEEDVDDEGGAGAEDEGATSHEA